MDSAIVVDHLDKSFRLPRERYNSLKGRIINFRKRGYDTQHVLKDISLDIKRGDFCGIVGRNGSGKSTLLKLLAGIYTPDSGTVTINGKLTPFIELGVGFNPELSGRDNVYLNGALLGFSRADVNRIYDDIVSFAELEKFMDQKLKNYSSGMQVRLAFSIAIRANTDVLVLDEVLAVGDEAFQRKCYDYFDELKRRGKTVVLVTHDMSAVQRFCTRAIVIQGGKIIFDGDTKEATDVYRSLNLEGTRSSIGKRNGRLGKTLDSKVIHGVTTTNAAGEETVIYGPRQPIVITATLDLSRVDEPIVQVWFNNPGGATLTRLLLDGADFAKNGVDIRKPFTLTWTNDGIFNDGKYIVTVEIDSGTTETIVDKHADVREFIVEGWDAPNILLHQKRRFTLTQ